MFSALFIGIHSINTVLYYVTTQLQTSEHIS